MKHRFAAVLLAGIFAAVMICAAAPVHAQIQITKGPTIERADSSSATITWSTNQPSSSRLWYGTDKNNLTQLAESSSSGDTHRVEIKNLQPGTTYYFQLESQRGSSEAEGAGVMSFRTPASGQSPFTNEKAQVAEKESLETGGQVKITSGPTLEEVSSNTATVAWGTNRKGSSRVEYGTDPNNLTQLGEASWGASGLTHRVELKNLKPDTTYYFRVETGQAQGTQGGEIESQKVMSFKTTAQGAAPVHNEQPR